MGSQGYEIARQVAARLNFRFVWREVINQAAIQVGAPEVALAVIDDLGLLHIYPSDEIFQSYIKAVHQVIQDLASQGGVVLLGRAGQIELHDHPQALHVRVIAPFEARVQRIAVEDRVPLEAARARVTASDKSRQQYLKKFYQARLEDPQLYDLVINTARLDAETAVKIICDTCLGDKEASNAAAHR